MKTLSEYFSDDGNRHAIVSLEEEVFVIDFFENGRYVKSECDESFTYQIAIDIAEDFVLYQETK